MFQSQDVCPFLFPSQVKKASASQDYEDLEDEIDNLREQRRNAMSEKAERGGVKMRIREL